MNSVLSNTLKKFVVAALLVLSAQFAWAQNPTQSPPDGNTAPPVNVSSTGQQKSGGLQVGSAIVDGGLRLGAVSLTGTCVGQTEGSVVYTNGAIYLCADADAVTTGTSSEIWTANGSTVYYESGGVAIGTDTLSPNTVLTLNGNLGVDSVCDALGNNCILHSDIGQSPWSVSSGNLFYNIGNIGIGTEFPSVKLQIEIDESSDQIPVIIKNLNTGANSIGLQFINATQVSEISSERTSVDSGADIVFSTNNSSGILTEGFRLTELGNIGLGDSTPDGTLRLDVAGSVGATSYCDQNGANCILANDLGDSLWDGSGSDIYTLGSNVGVGLSVPAHSIHTNQNIRVDGRHIFFGEFQDLYGDNITSLYYDSNHPDISAIQLRTSDNENFGSLLGIQSGGEQYFGLFDDTGSVIISNEKGNYTAFQVSSSTVLKLNNGGTVSIATTTVDLGLTLDVEGRVGATEYCAADGTNCIAASALGGSDDLGNHTASTTIVLNNNWISNDGGLEGIRILDNGNVGIGDVSPAQVLEVGGNISMSAGRRLYFGSQQLYGDNAGILYFNSNAATSRLVLRDSGATNMGSLYASSGGNFGFLDGDSHWSIRHVQDTDTRFLINNTEEMRLTTAGLAIGGTSLSGTLALDVTGQIGATEYCDENGANCIAATSLGGSDDLGNHTASTTVVLNDNWISNDGGSEGIRVANSGDVGINTAPVAGRALTILDTSATPLLVQRTTSANVTAEYRNATAQMFTGLTTNATGWGVANVADLGSSADLFVRRSDGNVGINDLDPSEKLEVGGNISMTAGRHIYLGSQDLYGDDGTSLYFDSNNGGQARFYLRSSTDDLFGGLYGLSGDYIGLLDGDSQWAYQHQKDTQHSWRINNIEEMRLLPAGLAIGDTSLSGTLALDVAGQIGATEYCDADGLNCQTAGSLGSVWDINVQGVHYDNQVTIGDTTYDTEGQLVVRNGNGRDMIILQTDDNTLDRGIAFRNAGGAYSNTIYSTNIGSNDTDLRIAGGDSNASSSSLVDYVTITGGPAGGDVGIGDMSPDATLKLDVEGQIGGSEFCDENGANCFDAADVSGAGGGGGGIITGGGTTDTLAKFNSSGGVADSQLSEAGSIVSASGNLAADGGHLYLGAAGLQDLYGDNNDNFYFDTNHANTGQITLRTSGNTQLGAIRGNVSGRVFGLMDADNNWSMLHYTDDSTRWRINSVEQMRLTTTGLGLGGETGPVSQLQIGQDTVVDGDNFISFGDRVTASEGNIPYIGQDSFDGVANDLGMGAYSSSGGINFYTGSAGGRFSNRRVRIDATGDVGIGDDTPDATLKLDVEGQIGATEYCDQNGANCVSAGALGGIWTEVASETYYAGHVGVGNTNPNSRLHVTDSTGVGTEIVRIQGETDAMVWENIGTGDYKLSNTQQSNGIEFYDGTGGIKMLYNNATVAEIDSTGGLDVLSGGIHVTGASDFSTNITVDGGHVYLGAAGAQDLYGDNAGILYFDSNAGSSRFILRDNGDDNFGSLYGTNGDLFGLLDGDGQWAIRHQKDVATSWRINNTEEMNMTSALLTVDNALHVRSSAEEFKVATGGVGMTYDVTTAGGWARELAFASNGTDRGYYGAYGANNTLNYLYIDASGSGTPYVNSHLVVQPSGDVGIGDTSPDATLKLDVEGQIGATEYCDQNGANCVAAASLGGLWTDVSSITTNSNAVLDAGDRFMVGSSAVDNVNIIARVTGDVNNDATIYGIYNLPTVGAVTLTANRNLYGTYSRPRINNTNRNGNALSITGSYAEAQIDGTLTSSNARGVYGVVDLNSSGLLSNAQAIRSELQIAAGSTVTSGVGLYVTLANSGTITTNYGILMADVVEGTMTNAYAFWTNEADMVLDGDGNGLPGGTHAGSDLWLGEGQDAGIWYDGTDLNINPQRIGSGVLDVNGTVEATGFVQTSDVRLKTNIETISNTSDVLKLRGVQFDWVDTGNADYGFVAQEVEQLFPELVRTGKDGFKSVNYANISALLLEQVKDQEVRLQELEARLQSLEQK